MGDIRLSASFTCTGCQFRSPNLRDMKRHILYSHCGEFPFQCGVCSLYFLSSSDALNHVQQLHETRSRHIIENGPARWRQFQAFLLHCTMYLEVDHVTGTLFLCALCERVRTHDFSILLRHLVVAHDWWLVLPMSTCNICAFQRIGKITELDTLRVEETMGYNVHALGACLRSCLRMIVQGGVQGVSEVPHIAEAWSNVAFLQGLMCQGGVMGNSRDLNDRRKVAVMWRANDVPTCLNTPRPSPADMPASPSLPFLWPFLPMSRFPFDPSQMFNMSSNVSSSPTSEQSQDLLSDKQAQTFGNDFLERIAKLYGKGSAQQTSKNREQMQNLASGSTANRGEDFNPLKYSMASFLSAIQAANGNALNGSGNTESSSPTGTMGDMIDMHNLPPVSQFFRRYMEKNTARATESNGNSSGPAKISSPPAIPTSTSPLANSFISRFRSAASKLKAQASKSQAAAAAAAAAAAGSAAGQAGLKRSASSGNLVNNVSAIYENSKGFSGLCTDFRCFNDHFLQNLKFFKEGFTDMALDLTKARPGDPFASGFPFKLEKTSPVSSFPRKRRCSTEDEVRDGDTPLVSSTDKPPSSPGSHTVVETDDADSCDVTSGQTKADTVEGKQDDVVDTTAQVGEVTFPGMGYAPQIRSTEHVKRQIGRAHV